MSADLSSGGNKTASQLPAETAKSLTDSETLALAREWGEAAFDATLESGALKDAPVVGILFKLVALPWSIRDRIFLKKLSTFLPELSSVPEEKRREFRGRIDADSKLLNRVGEGILLLLDRADDMEKPALIGKAFVAYLTGKVSYDQLARMTAGIDKASISDIRELRRLQDFPVLDERAAGLLRRRIGQALCCPGLGGQPSGPQGQRHR